MGSKLKERAKRARTKGADEAPTAKEAPASSKASPTGAKPKGTKPVTTKPKAESKASDPQAARPADTADAPDDNVVDIADRAISRLSDEQVEAAVAAANPEDVEPFTASLVATRETKAEQVQYDGKTPEGYIIRVWAPKGTSMLIGATLTEVS